MVGWSSTPTCSNTPRCAPCVPLCRTQLAPTRWVVDQDDAHARANSSCSAMCAINIYIQLQLAPTRRCVPVCAVIPHPTCSNLLWCVYEHASQLQLAPTRWAVDQDNACNSDSSCSAPVCQGLAVCTLQLAPTRRGVYTNLRLCSVACPPWCVLLSATHMLKLAPTRPCVDQDDACNSDLSCSAPVCIRTYDYAQTCSSTPLCGSRLCIARAHLSCSAPVCHG